MFLPSLYRLSPEVCHFMSEFGDFPAGQLFEWSLRSLSASDSMHGLLLRLYFS